MANSVERVVVLIDMDCFYVQVEQRRQPNLKGMPCAVVQYNKWKGGGIIAVSYEARAKGVSRNMRGDDAKEKCPEIALCMVPTANGKADLTRYRDAGAEVIQVLLQFGGIVERASIDEAYIDLTEVVNQKMKNSDIINVPDILPSLQELEHTYVVGYPKTTDNKTTDGSDVQAAGLDQYKEVRNANSACLLIAAAIVEEMRLAIYEQTTFRCSAGISHNKVLAKLACGINKPNKQTILPMESVPALFNQIKIGKIRNLGGKLGQLLTQNLGIECIGQLTQVPKSTLIEMHGAKTGEWLYEICRGIDHEAVKERHVAQSVGCSKTFRGGDALNTRSKVKHWIDCLVTELVERLKRDQELNNRTSKSLTVGVGFHNQKSISRACQISQYTLQDISRNVMATLELLNQSKDRQTDVWTPAITVISISAGKFLNAIDKSQAKLKPVKMSRKSLDDMNSKQSEQVSELKADEETNNIRKFLSTSPKVPNNTQVEKNHPQQIDAPKFALTPSKTAATKESLMDKKRSFFTQNFGVADKRKPSISESISSDQSHILSPDKSVIATESKSSETTSATKKKQSFFAKLREVSAVKKSSCKIENAFEELTNINHTSKGKTPDKHTEKELHHHPETNAIPSVVVSSPSKPNRPAMDEVPRTSLSMDDIDMDVFNSLPLYLQHEIRSASQKPDTNLPNVDIGSKRRKLEQSNGQTSITGFFNQSPTKEPVNSSRKKLSPVLSKKVKSKTSKRSSQFKQIEENAVPFGFFRARSQASAAIRDAVEKQALLSQKRKTDDRFRLNID